jgi:tetratricopeptide (TPR) repeat protein
VNLKRVTLSAGAVLGLLALPGLASAACASGGPRARAAAPAPDDLQEGISLFQQGKYAAAESALRRAEGPEANAYLAGALAKQRKYAEAEAPAKAALEANATHEVAVAALGEALVGQKKYDEADARLSAAIGAKPDLAYAYFWRAQAYNGLKKADRMVADYETFLKLAPKAPEAPSVQQLLASFR